MTETALQNEISRRAPGLKIISIGRLFGGKELDAVVEDRRGQYPNPLSRPWHRCPDNSACFNEAGSGKRPARSEGPVDREPSRR